LNHGTEVELFSTGDNELSESNSITSVGGFVCFTLRSLNHLLFYLMMMNCKFGFHFQFAVDFVQRM
jgi:hypothetical protein